MSGRALITSLSDLPVRCIDTSSLESIDERRVCAYDLGLNSQTDLRRYRYRSVKSVPVILNPLSQILLLNLGITQDQASLIVLSANSGSLTIETESTIVLPP